MPALVCFVRDDESRDINVLCHQLVTLASSGACEMGQVGTGFAQLRKYIVQNLLQCTPLSYMWLSVLFLTSSLSAFSAPLACLGMVVGFLVAPTRGHRDCLPLIIFILFCNHPYVRFTGFNDLFGGTETTF